MNLKLSREVWDLLIEKVGLEKGDEFKLKNVVDDSNPSPNTVFTFNGEDVHPFALASREGFWIQILIGKFVIVKI